MDFGWAAGGPLSPGRPVSGGGAGGDLNLLGDNLLIDLDDRTLQVALVSLHTPSMREPANR